MRKLRIYPDDVLKKEAEPVENPERWSELVEDMRQIVSEKEGVGLAAPQVGESVRLFLMRDGPDELQWSAYFNPEIIKIREKERIPESCLSFPGVQIEAKRGRVVTFRALTAAGKEVEKTVENLLAQCVQHEVDHLDGITLVDHASLAEKMEMQKQLLEEDEVENSGA